MYGGRDRAALGSWQTRGGPGTMTCAQTQVHSTPQIITYSVRKGQSDHVAQVDLRR